MKCVLTFALDFRYVPLELPHLISMCKYQGNKMCVPTIGSCPRTMSQYTACGCYFLVNNIDNVLPEVIGIRFSIPLLVFPERCVSIGNRECHVIDIDMFILTNV